MIEKFTKKQAENLLPENSKFVMNKKQKRVWQIKKC
jgi:hypothetical protein